MLTDRHELAQRRVGSTLGGKWTLDALLGVGGMAAVYSATHRNGARAAIKLLPFSVTTTPQVCERFLREGKHSNSIDHPAIVRVLDDHIDHEKEYAYLVMELLHGETARERVERDGPLPALEAVRICIQLADCLRVAHERKIVHRDIKPENLFLDAAHGDRLKVLDFGIARALDAEGPGLTRTGTSLGTPAYMSPEQARGKASELTLKTDIYSIGATLLFLVSGRTVHEGETAQELMVRAAWTPALPSSQLAPGLHPRVCAAIDRACAFQPAERYAGASELLDALRNLESRLELTPPAALDPVEFAPAPITASYALPQGSLPASQRGAETVGEAPLPPPSRMLPRLPLLMAAAVSTGVVAAGTWLLATTQNVPTTSEIGPVRVALPTEPPEQASPPALHEAQQHAPTASDAREADEAVDPPSKTNPARARPSTASPPARPQPKDDKREAAPVRPVGERDLGY